VTFALLDPWQSGDLLLQRWWRPVDVGGNDEALGIPGLEARDCCLSASLPAIADVPAHIRLVFFGLFISRSCAFPEDGRDRMLPNGAIWRKIPLFNDSKLSH